jgi:mannosylglycoprotein endo-beta-mannosidase
LSEELEKLESLGEEMSLSADMLSEKSLIQTEMLRLTEEEENYWHKRSNNMWLLKGDNNTAFFHRIANGKKKKEYHFLFEPQ